MLPFTGQQVALLSVQHVNTHAYGPALNLLETGSEARWEQDMALILRIQKIRSGAIYKIGFHRIDGLVCVDETHWQDLLEGPFQEDFPARGCISYRLTDSARLRSFSQQSLPSAAGFCSWVLVTEDDAVEITTGTAASPQIRLENPGLC